MPPEDGDEPVHDDRVVAHTGSQQPSRDRRAETPTVQRTVDRSGYDVTKRFDGRYLNNEEMEVLVMLPIRGYRDIQTTNGMSIPLVGP